MGSTPAPGVLLPGVALPGVPLPGVSVWELTGYSGTVITRLLCLQRLLYHGTIRTMRMHGEEVQAQRT